MIRYLTKFPYGKGLVVVLQILSLLSVQLWTGEAFTAPEYQEVKVESVIRDPRSAQPVVILANLQRQRGMLIWIGEAEARALDAAKRGITHYRPLTHDLLSGILGEFHASITQVRITELRDDIFYARLFIQTPSQQIAVDARPSDAMVLALKTSCPIFVETSLFQDQSLPLDLPPLHLYGLEVQELTDELKSVLGYMGEGILVAQVQPDSQASRDGILREDILVEAAGKPIRQVEDLENAFSEAQGHFEVQVFRNGSLQSFTLNAQPGS